MGYTHGTVWSDELVEKSILEVVKGLNLDHFPTHNEMIEYFGNKELACKIAKDRGTLAWAEKLRLPLKNSETTFGNGFEVYAISDIYEHTELCSVQTSSGHPYDLIVDNCVKIDVKASMGFKNSTNSLVYSFNLKKREPTCDIFLLYCVNEDQSIHKTVIVPSCRLLGQTQLGIGEKSKWDKYMDKWNIIAEYSDFFNRYKR